MITEDKLYQLIHSLTFSEKGFFKKTFTNYGKSENMLIFKLFEIYNNLKSYDEQFLKKAIKKNDLEKHENKIKSELYQAILDALKQYNRKDTPYEKIDSLLDDFNVLINKLQYTEAKKRINKAKKIAIECEYYDQWINIIKKERDLFSLVAPNPETIKNQVESNLRELEEIQRHKNDETKTIELNYRTLLNLISIGTESLELIQKKSKQLFIDCKLDEKTLSKRNEIVYLAAKAHLAIIEQNEFEFIKLEKLLHEKSLSKDYENVISAAKKIGLIFNIRAGVNRKNDKAYLDRIINCCKIFYKQIPSSAKKDKKFAEYILLLLEIEEAIFQKKYHIAIDYLNSKINNEKISTKHNITENLISIYLELGLIYLLNKNYRETIRTLNQIYLKTNQDYGAVQESEIIFLMLLANIKLNQIDSVEILAKDYLTVYAKNNLVLPIRKNIVEFILKNSFLNESKLINEMKKIVEKSEHKDFTYSHGILNIDLWLRDN